MPIISYNCNALCDCPSKSNDINSMEEQVIWFVQFSKQQGVRLEGLREHLHKNQERKHTEQ